MERRLAAIVAADVVGYSRLIRADEDGTLAVLQTLRAEVVSPAIARHHGRIVKLMGDGMLAEFASAADAVAFSTEVQQAIAERAPHQPPDRRIVFRIGVNLGDVVIDGDDIQGDGVNLAARLEALAAPGCVCISGTVHELVRDWLALAFEDLGEREVKNIDRPVRVWQWRAGQAGTAAPPAPQLPERPSIAVLPFDNLSADREQEYFADGMVEDVITALSRNRDLFVIARNSSFAYRGKSVDIRQVGRELGVRYVVEGSVRRAGNRVRITLQLIEAATGNHIWAERYDRPVDDIFEVQDEITANVAGAVGSEIRMADFGRLSRHGVDGLGSWERLMKAHWHVRRINAEDNRIGCEICRAEIAKGNRAFHAPLVAGLAFDLLRNLSGRPPAELIREGMIEGRRAIEADPNSATSHAFLAFFYTWSGDHATAKDHAETAVRLDPNDVLAHQALGGVLAFSGAEHAAAARAELALALRLGPRDLYRHATFGNLAACELIAGDYAAAMDAARASLQMNAGWGPAHRVIVAALELSGRGDEAAAAARRALELAPVDPAAYQASMRRAFRKAEDVEKLFAALRSAGYLPP